ncbi:MAG: hypothetical protein ACR2OB_14040 [Solirubrobacteraceae bacterium]
MDPTQEMAAWFESRADEMAGPLEELVAVETENPPGRSLGSSGAVLRNALERADLSPELIEVAPSADLTIHGVVRGGVGDGPRTIHFHGHFDVASAQPPDQCRPVPTGRQDHRSWDRGHEGQSDEHDLWRGRRQ